MKNVEDYMLASSHQQFISQIGEININRDVNMRSESFSPCQQIKQLIKHSKPFEVRLEKKLQRVRLRCANFHQSSNSSVFSPLQSLSIAPSPKWSIYDLLSASPQIFNDFVVCRFSNICRRIEKKNYSRRWGIHEHKFSDFDVDDTFISSN